jgi:hypothetical protein
LFRNGFRDCGVGVPERAYRDAADRIQIARAAFIDELTPLARDNRYRRAFVIL